MDIHKMRALAMQAIDQYPGTAEADKIHFAYVAENAEIESQRMSASACAKMATGVVMLQQAVNCQADGADERDLLIGGLRRTLPLDRQPKSWNP